MILKYKKNSSCRICNNDNLLNYLKLGNHPPSNSFIEEKDLNNELELNKYKTSILDVYQSGPFWQKVNNLELFSNCKNNILRAVVPPANNEKLMKFLKNNLRENIFVK